MGKQLFSFYSNITYFFHKQTNKSLFLRPHNGHLRFQISSLKKIILQQHLD